MDDRMKEKLLKVGITPDSFEPKKEPLTIEISREDFDLLDVETDGTIYHIVENDGTITIKKGENR